WYFRCGSGRLPPGRKARSKNQETRRCPGVETGEKSGCTCLGRCQQVKRSDPGGVCPGNTGLGAQWDRKTQKEEPRLYRVEYTGGRSGGFWREYKQDQYTR